MATYEWHILNIIFILHLCTAHANKLMNTRPVHEHINEQSRLDDRVRQINLPFSNPLAGQNALLHAKNQQAMFNAERIRQHQIQIQRMNKMPRQMDSYMKAYQESHENLHLTLEQQQAKLRESRHIPKTTDHKTVSVHIREPKDLHNVRKVKVNEVRPISPTTYRPNKMFHDKANNEKRLIKIVNPTKITFNDAIKPDIIRNQRSYGSAYQKYLEPKKGSVFIAPGPTYDQGVTIKPNGNIGLTQTRQEESNKLYTEAIPSITKYVYPKQYNQMQNYQFAETDSSLNTLSSILNNIPQESLKEAPISQNAEGQSKEQFPIDLFFYLKDPPSHHQSQAQIDEVPVRFSPPSGFKEYKDHTSVNEDEEIVELNTKTHFKLPSYIPALSTNEPEHGPQETKAKNYYKVEVGNQVISESFKNNHVNDKEVPFYGALKYTAPVIIPISDSQNEDNNGNYLHHNAQPTVVHHLTVDGTEVPAYNSDDIHYASNYEFGYRVMDPENSNDFGHHEAKRGENTKGQYHVLLPDGRMQQVKYSAGPEGFHADISYDHLLLSYSR